MKIVTQHFTTHWLIVEKNFKKFSIKGEHEAEILERGDKVTGKMEYEMR